MYIYLLESFCIVVQFVLKIEIDSDYSYSNIMYHFKYLYTYDTFPKSSLRYLHS